REVIIHSENGILGMGPTPEPDKINPWLINASKKYVTLRPGGSYMHHADSFAVIRGGHLDLCVLGAFQVAENGDFANWATSENDHMPSVGGAMDLAVGAERVWVLMEHTTKRCRRSPTRCCAWRMRSPSFTSLQRGEVKTPNARSHKLGCKQWLLSGRGGADIQIGAVSSGATLPVAAVAVATSRGGATFNPTQYLRD